jgi:hypothetical protein
VVALGVRLEGAWRQHETAVHHFLAGLGTHEVVVVGP